MKAVQNYSAIEEIIIADINQETAETFASSLNRKVSAIQLDVNDGYRCSR
jgi:saccharopine dehydrogenase-like NADP-dependent oxidoreductase